MFYFFCFLFSQMKGCIKVLKDQPPNSVEGLLNALRCVYVWVHMDQKGDVRKCFQVRIAQRNEY